MPANPRIRQMALALLSDEHGISSEAYDILHPMLSAAEGDDILGRVKAIDGRWYLSPEETPEQKSRRLFEAMPRATEPTSVTIYLSPTELQALRFWALVDSDFSLGPENVDADDFLLKLATAAGIDFRDNEE